MKTSTYGNGSIYRRQDGRWVAAVCSRDPVTGKTIRTYSYGKTKQEALQKKMELLAKNKELPVTSGLTARHS
jgi:predicted RNase H-like HicB family nuclease